MARASDTRSSGGTSANTRRVGTRLMEARLTFAAAVAMAVLIVVVGGTAYLDKLARSALTDEAMRVTAVLARAVSVDVGMRDSEHLLVALDATRAVPEVAYAVVRQSSGEVLAGRETRRYVRADLLVAQEVYAIRDGGMLHVVAPVPGPDGAAVQLGYELDSLGRWRFANLALTGALGVMLAAAGVALSGVMGARKQSVAVADAPVAEDPREVAIAGLYNHDFLAYISHELRTPLTAIIGYGEMLEEDAVFLEQTDFVPDLKKIRKAGEHLLALVDDIVDLIRLRSGQLALTVRSFDVRLMVEEVERDVAPLLDRTLSTLVVELGDGVESMAANRQLVRRSLTNMIRFVCGLTVQGELRLVLSKRIEGDRRWIAFELTHPGLFLEPEQISALMDDFTPASSAQLPQYHGSGLGFVITRGFCQRMGGQFDIRSTPSDGATLTMKLPAFVDVG